MQEITFKEYCGKKQFRTLSDLAADIGVSISYLSKLYNSQPTGVGNGPAWRKIYDFVAKDGYKLIKVNELDVASTFAMRENEKLKEIIADKDQQIALLKMQIEQYEQIVRIAKAIVETNEEIKNKTKHKRKRLR